MHELIYAGREVEDLIKTEYPGSKITDASDYIHTERFECELPDIDEDDFYPFAIREGFAMCCFGFAINLESIKFPENKKGEHEEIKARIRKWAELAKGKT